MVVNVCDFAEWLYEPVSLTAIHADLTTSITGPPRVMPHMMTTEPAASVHAIVIRYYSASSYCMPLTQGKFGFNSIG